MENLQRTHWQVWTLLSPVSHFGKLHRLETRENGAHRSWHRESNRLVNKELSDLWRIVATEVTVSLKLEELAAFLNRLNSENSSGLDSIFLEFILHARSAPKSWFYGSFISRMRQLKIPKIWCRELIVANLKPEKPLGSRRTNSNVPISLLSVSLTSSRDSSTLVSIQSLSHCSLRSRRVFDMGGRP